MRAWKIGTNTQPASTTTAPTAMKSLRDSRVDFPDTAKFQKVQMTPLCRRAPDVVRVTSSCRLVPKVVSVVDVARLDPKVVRELPTDEPGERGVGCQPYLGPRDVISCGNPEQLRLFSDTEAGDFDHKRNGQSSTWCGSKR